MEGRVIVQEIVVYAAYFATAIGLFAAFVAIYGLVTPYRELKLIRQGNRTAAISMGGALIGFGLPLAGTLASSASVVDLAMWGAVALVAQLLVFFVANMALAGFREGVESDKNSYGITLASLSVAVGLINAGAVTY